MMSMIMTGLVVLLAIGPQSVQGRTVTFQNYVCTIRDSDNELVSCTFVYAGLPFFSDL